MPSQLHCRVLPNDVVVATDECVGSQIDPFEKRSTKGGGCVHPKGACAMLVENVLFPVSSVPT